MVNENESCNNADDPELCQVEEALKHVEPISEEEAILKGLQELVKMVGKEQPGPKQPGAG